MRSSLRSALVTGAILSAAAAVPCGVASAAPQFDWGVNTKGWNITINNKSKNTDLNWLTGNNPAYPLLPLPGFSQEIDHESTGTVTGRGSTFGSGPADILWSYLSTSGSTVTGEITA